MRITIENPFTKIKNHSHYTQKQINDLIRKANNQYLYDYLIDKLYFLQANKHNTKKSHEYSFLSARVLREREVKESSLDRFFDK